MAKKMNINNTFLKQYGFSVVEESAKSRIGGLGWGDALFIK